MSQESKDAIPESAPDTRKRIALNLPEDFRKAFESEAKKRGVQPAELAKVWLYEIMKAKQSSEA